MTPPRTPEADARLAAATPRPVRRSNAVAWVLLAAFAALSGLVMGYALGVVL